jgi:hypothetical protein
VLLPQQRKDLAELKRTFPRVSPAQIRDIYITAGYDREAARAMLLA